MRTLIRGLCVGVVGAGVISAAVLAVVHPELRPWPTYALMGVALVALPLTYWVFR